MPPNTSQPSVFNRTVGLFFLSGIILLLGSLLMTPVRPGLSSLFIDLLRELGTAILIAVVVGVLIEFYRSERHHIQTVNEIASVLTGIDPNVWTDVHELLREKKVIRRDLRIRLEVQRSPELRDHEAILLAEIDYDLHGLINKHVSVQIEHELDYQFDAPALTLPRFDRIAIEIANQEPRVYTSEEIRRQFPDGRFRHQIDVPAREHGCIRVRTQRRELVHAPGSYNLYLPEFTKGINIRIARLPDEVRAEMLIRPLGTVLKEIGNEWLSDALLFPGQGIEIKFVPRYPGR